MAIFNSYVKLPEGTTQYNPAPLERAWSASAAESAEEVLDLGAALGRTGSFHLADTASKNILTFGFVWKCWVNIPNEIAI